MRLQLVAALLLTACANRSLTEVVITVEPDGDVFSRAPSFTVEVTRQSDGLPLHVNSNVPWRDGKYTLALSPESERDAEPYQVVVTASDRGTPFAVARLLSGYVVGETRYVRLRLGSGCSAACDEVSTCHESLCVPARAEASTFADRRADAPLSVAAMPIEPGSRPGEPVPPDGGVPEGMTTTEVAAPLLDAATPQAPMRYGPRTEPRTMVAGSTHNCATKADGTAYCWGQNGSGKFGNGMAAGTFLLPVAVRGLTDVDEIVGGFSHTCARRRNGRVYCWGANGIGQLGLGSYTQQLLPVEVPGLTDVAELAAGGTFTCARKADGSVACWGNNGAGQLGTGRTVTESRPTPVVGLRDVVEIAVGDSHACARIGDGTVMCWGNNFNGELGNGGVATSTVPVQVVGLRDAVSIAAGAAATCAVRSDATALCWGNNYAGNVGNGETGDVVTPTQVLGLSGAVQMSLASGHTCARTREGAVWCWGNNDNGKLGNRTLVHSHAPVQVLGVTGMAHVATGLFETCVRLPAYGPILCWGDNRYGQLGDGTTVDRLVPTTVMGL